MPNSSIRHHGQRQHIIQSLETLLYQLHTLSFFLSPRVWSLICRCSTQFQFSRPRDLDGKRSLRFWFFLILFFNAGSVYAHASEGAAEGRGVVLDFVGMAYTPSKVHLLFLDFFIILLQMVLTTISYETSLTLASPPETPDPLLPSLTPTPLETETIFAYEPISDEDPDNTDKPPPPPPPESPYIIDLRLSHLVARLRNPAPTPPEQESDAGLPLPGSTSISAATGAATNLPAALPAGLRMILRARLEMRARAERERQDREREREARGGQGASENAGSGRVPGALDADDNG